MDRHGFAEIQAAYTFSVVDANATEPKIFALAFKVVRSKHIALYRPANTRGTNL